MQGRRKPPDNTQNKGAMIMERLPLEYAIFPWTRTSGQAGYILSVWHPVTLERTESFHQTHNEAMRAYRSARAQYAEAPSVTDC